MTGLVRFPSFPRTLGRLQLALALSALAHGALLAIPLVETRWPGAAPGAIDMPMTVRFAPPPAAVPEPAAVTHAEGSRMPALAGSSRHGESALAVTVVAPPDADAPVVLRVPDPTYYAARDLDTYPRPARPLELERPSGLGSIRLLLLIDEHGVVNEISPVEAGRLDEALRAALAATRFIPGRKDGRDVKSRVLLSVGPGFGSGD
jgi:hypothetical protein